MWGGLFNLFQFLLTQRSNKKTFLWHKLSFFLALCWWTEVEVRGNRKRTHSGKAVAAYRAAFILRGHCIPASTVSRMQELTSLLVRWAIFSPSQTGVCTFWPWCQHSSDRSCWIACLSLPQRHAATQTFLFFSCWKEYQKAFLTICFHIPNDDGTVVNLNWLQL